MQSNRKISFCTCWNQSRIPCNHHCRHRYIRTNTVHKVSALSLETRVSEHQLTLYYSSMRIFFVSSFSQFMDIRYRIISLMYIRAWMLIQSDYHLGSGGSFSPFRADYVMLYGIFFTFLSISTVCGNKVLEFTHIPSLHPHPFP